LAFATAIGASEVVVPGVLLPVIDFCDPLAPQIRVMLTTPAVIHDAAVIDCAIGIQTKRSAAFARRNLDRRGGRIRIGNGACDRCVVSRVCTRPDVTGVSRARNPRDASGETAISERLDLSIPSAL